MPEISVIVPVYNSERYLDKCVKSILNQDYKDFELILVDDGSTDRSYDVCQKWAKSDDRVHIIRKSNGGLSDARNYGINASRGNYITFIDSDDYVTNDYLSYLYSLFEYSDKCLITNCNRQMIKNDKLGQKFSYGESPVAISKNKVYEWALYTKMSHGAVARLFKRQVFNSLRFPVGRKHEDTYMLPDFIDASEEMVFGPKVCYFYVVNINSIAHSSSWNRFNDLIVATQRLADRAINNDPALKSAAICKMAHAKLSVLSMMEIKNDDDRRKAQNLKEEILACENYVYKDPGSLKRDKIATLLLRVGGIKFMRLNYTVYRKFARK